ncbi:uncharacterized protein LOC125529407 [Triticum urartu]|uniref:uncharacterized protein LOC125529407 n=1 Tax=Triticum urartu TaxID=4572 RepID=UPI0020444F79|nr:uncharacterized protein LOC125529407 [Triticum urartu]
MSASSESEVDGFLLIETLAREQGLYDLEDSHGASSWLVPVDPTMIPKMVIPGADHHKVQVVEVDGEVDPKLKTSAEYVVQLPSPDRNEEIVLTPPLAPEGVHRFSKRNARSMQENVEARAVRVANEKDGAGKNTRNKPYVPRLKSAAYAIMITLYREMERGKEFMMRQELIDAAEASGLSEHAIGSNNSRNSRNDGYSYTGWNSMKKLTNKDLVKKKSNPAKKRQRDSS